MALIFILHQVLCMYKLYKQYNYQHHITDKVFVPSVLHIIFHNKTISEYYGFSNARSSFPAMYKWLIQEQMHTTNNTVCQTYHEITEEF